MSEETKLTVPQMLKLTGQNTSEFMTQVAEHVEKLEQAVADLTARIAELEASNGNNTPAQ
jgi:phage shock protein A